jgi:peptide/nickel transport system permease protein
MFLYLQADYLEKRPFVSLTWLTPDGRKFDLRGISVDRPLNYNFEENIPYKRLVAANEHLQKWFELGKVYPTPAHTLLFVDPNADTPVTVHGAYHLQVNVMFFEPDGEARADLVLLGQVYGPAGTDYLRRDLLVPLLWGLPFALLFGLLGALVTTVISMIVAAAGVWFGGWVDNLIQRLTEANMILPVLAIGVLAQALFNISLWIILAVVVLLNIFGSPTKTFRAAFLQMKTSPYIEAAQAYNASNRRIIFSYLLPRIIPVLVPQLITLIPSYVFLEATLGLFNIKSDYPTWGTVIYQALIKGAMWGSTYWVLEPLAMLLLTGLAFAMLGSALERILNPRLQGKD